MEVSQFDVSKYPPLSLCSVVDTRISSRRKVVDDLKQSKLFSTVVEPASVADAITLIKERQFDACLVGSTLSREAALDFLQEGKRLENAKSCAFVALVPKYAAEMDSYLQGGAHRVVKLPYKTTELYQGVVDAVVEVDRSSPWAEIRLPELRGQTPADVQMDLSQLLAGFIGDLDLSEADQASIYETVDSIRTLVDTFRRAKAQSPRVQEFSKFLENCVREWFLDIAEKPEVVATQALRDKLLMYQKK